MFKLVYQQFSAQFGWKNVEENFLSGEHRTVIEIARFKQEQPNKYRFIRVLDHRLVKAEVISVKPTDPDAGRLIPQVLSRVFTTVPACSVLDLSKLPQKKTAKVPVAGPDVFPQLRRKKAVAVVS